MFSPTRTLLLVSLVLLHGALSVATAQVYPFDFDTKPARGFMPAADQIDPQPRAKYRCDADLQSWGTNSEKQCEVLTIPMPAFSAWDSIVCGT